jgi:replicative DNA helicase
VSDTQHDDAQRTQYDDPTMPAAALISERAILGAALWHGPHVAKPLVAEDFYVEWHRELFRIIHKLYADNPRFPYLDVIAVKDELFRLGLHARATDMLFMFDEAIARCVSHLSAAYHVERILDAAETRIGQTYGQRLTALANKPERAAEVAEQMQAALHDLRLRAGAGDDMEKTKLAELVRLNDLAAAVSKPARATGLKDLDKILNGGLRPATLNVLGARPGVGKSMLAGTLALNMAKHAGVRVLYVTLELTAAEVTNRLLSSIANVELTHLQNPEQRDENDFYRLSEAELELEDYPIHVVDGSQSIEQIELLANRYLGSAPAGLLIVDYLGRIREDGKAANRERHIGIAASRLTDLAHDLKVPVLCVVSFSRESVRRGGPPRVDDIRDSGTVESDADTALLLWQPDPGDADRIEVVVAKNRYGIEGKINLAKQGYRGRFADYTGPRRAS